MRCILIAGPTILLFGSGFVIGALIVRLNLAGTSLVSVPTQDVILAVVIAGIAFLASLSLLVFKELRGLKK